MPREINLREYVPCGPYTLTARERRALEAVKAGISIAPDSEQNDAYMLTASSKVGAFETGGLSVLIEPKIDIPQLLSLACYAMGHYRPQDDSGFNFEERISLPDIQALALVQAARQAFSRGLLHGYRKREEALQTVRGRIRFADQVRRRYGIAPPVEVRYEEFTDDVLENQLIKAAAHRLGSLRLRSAQARRGLGWIAGTLDNVTFQEFSPNAVPEVTPSRINDHYSDVIAISRLILRHGAFESERGGIRASGFLMDMNVVFQEFVTTALTEQLRDAPGVLRSDKELTGDRQVFLDADRHIRLEPDLTWWQDGICTFVGDAKYKNLADRSTPNADLYQLLAYATALDLPGGTLIYAQGEAEPRTYAVNYAGKRLSVVALDISRPLGEVLEQVRDIARRLKRSAESRFPALQPLRALDSSLRSE